MPRPCSVCTSPKRAEIDRALIGGEPFRVLAARTGTSATALTRHKKDHLSIVKHHASGDVVSVVSAQRGTRDRPLSDDANALRTRAISLLEQVEEGIPIMGPDGKAVTNSEGEPFLAIDFRAAAGLIREARGCLELEAKLLGELQTGAAVTVQVLVGDPGAPPAQLTAAQLAELVARVQAFARTILADVPGALDAWNAGMDRAVLALPMNAGPQPGRSRQGR